MFEHRFALRQPQHFAFHLELRTSFAASTAAAALFRKMAAASRVAAVKLPITPPQRQLPSLSPRVRHYGGCSRVSRRL